jgi:hypothetical protein
MARVLAHVPVGPRVACVVAALAVGLKGLGQPFVSEQTTFLLFKGLEADILTPVLIVLVDIIYYSCLSVDGYISLRHFHYFRSTKCSVHTFL